MCGYESLCVDRNRAKLVTARHVSCVLQAIRERRKSQQMIVEAVALSVKHSNQLQAEALVPIARLSKYPVVSTPLPQFAARL